MIKKARRAPPAIWRAGLQLHWAEQALPLQRGITVIELITAIAIIFILIAALLPVLSKSREMAKKRNAQEVIHQLEVAIRMYADDCGQYPPDDAGADCYDLIDYLENHGVDPPYCEWPADMKSAGNLLDPWKKPYRYRTSNVEGIGMAYNIWSIGPDGNDDNGEDDDIRNW